MKQKLALACTLVHEPALHRARRADDRRRSGVAPRVLEAAVGVSVAGHHHRDGDAVSRRGGAMRARRAAARGPAARARSAGRAARRRCPARSSRSSSPITARARRAERHRRASPTCRCSASARTSGWREASAAPTDRCCLALDGRRPRGRERAADCRRRSRTSFIARLHRDCTRRPSAEASLA